MTLYPLFHPPFHETQNWKNEFYFSIYSDIKEYSPAGAHINLFLRDSNGDSENCVSFCLKCQDWYSMFNMGTLFISKQNDSFNFYFVPTIGTPLNKQLRIWTLEALKYISCLKKYKKKLIIIEGLLGYE